MGTVPSGSAPVTAQEAPAAFSRQRPALDALIDSGPLLALFNRGDRWHPPTPKGQALVNLWR